MAYPKKEERISKLVFPFRFKSKDKWKQICFQMFGFFCHVYKHTKREKGIFNVFFLYNVIKKKRTKKMYVCVHKQQRTDVTRKDNEN
jgi:hypothetical protein